MKVETRELIGHVISTYSRAQAIEDGILIDVTKTAVEAGFSIPIAITNRVWNSFIEWKDSDTQLQTYQDTDGRLWDVLSMLRFAIKKTLNNQVIHYKLFIVPRDGKSIKAKTIKLKATISAGDNGEPVITIMLPNED